MAEVENQVIYTSNKDTQNNRPYDLNMNAMKQFITVHVQTWWLSVEALALGFLYEFKQLSAAVASHTLHYDEYQY